MLSGAFVLMYIDSLDEELLKAYANIRDVLAACHGAAGV